MIQILSGPVQSRKTTTLMHWCKPRHDCGGILSPDVEGVRHLYDVRQQTRWSWQKSHRASPADQTVGRFVFDGESFAKAVGVLRRDMADPAVRYLIVDEVGPLELQGGGWDPWLREVLPFPRDRTLILVVRESLVEEVIDAYLLTGYEVVSIDYFIS